MPSTTCVVVVSLTTLGSAERGSAPITSFSMTGIAPRPSSTSRTLAAAATRGSRAIRRPSRCAPAPKLGRAPGRLGDVLGLLVGATLGEPRRRDVRPAAPAAPAGSPCGGPRRASGSRPRARACRRGSGPWCRCQERVGQELDVELAALERRDAREVDARSRCGASHGPEAELQEVERPASRRSRRSSCPSISPPIMAAGTPKIRGDLLDREPPRLDELAVLVATRRAPSSVMPSSSTIVLCRFPGPRGAAASDSRSRCPRRRRRASCGWLSTPRGRGGVRGRTPPP